MLLQQCDQPGRQYTMEEPPWLAGVPAGGACFGRCRRAEGIVPAVLRTVSSRREAERVSALMFCHSARSEHVFGTQHQMLGCSSCAVFETISWRRREERIEKVGPLGKAAVQNKALDAIEQDLRRAAQVDQADGMCLYLLGVVLAER